MNKPELLGALTALVLDALKAVFCLNVVGEKVLLAEHLPALLALVLHGELQRLVWVHPLLRTQVKYSREGRAQTW